MVRIVKEKLRSVRPVPMTVTVETRYDIIGCRNYIKIKDDYDKNEKNVADDRSDDGGSTIK